MTDYFEVAKQITRQHVAQLRPVIGQKVQYMDSGKELSGVYEGHIIVPAQVFIRKPSGELIVVDERKLCSNSYLSQVESLEEDGSGGGWFPI